MSTKDTIINKLREAFSPESLDVSDESHLHEGHAGHRPGGETHFRVYIVSPAFEGKSRIERHRMINSTLAGELAGSVHALAIQAQAPGRRIVLEQGNVDVGTVLADLPVAVLVRAELVASVRPSASSFRQSFPAHS